jgi:ubiquinone/menaquinone biosynthesis C-methylase UbiE
MHDTSGSSIKAFCLSYGKEGNLVVEIGGADCNYSRTCFVEEKMDFLCLDTIKTPRVDIVFKFGEKLPLPDNSADIVVSSSHLERDPFFWVTFKEMARIVKQGGYIYCSTISNGTCKEPRDHWRFYADAGLALTEWANSEIYGLPSYKLKLIESFHILPDKDIWVDYVCIWKKGEDENKKEPVKDILTNSGLKTIVRTPRTR